MKFFSDCKTQEEAKKTFNRLAKLFHPDKGGDKELMIELKNQFDSFDPNKREEPLHFKSNFMNHRPPYSSYATYSGAGTRSRVVSEEEMRLKRDLDFAHDRLADNFMQNKALKEEISGLNTVLRQQSTECMKLCEELAETQTLVDHLKLQLKQIPTTWWGLIKYMFRRKL